MDWLQESTSHHLIVLQHRVGTRFTFRWNRLVKEIRSNLFSYGNVPDEKQKALESRIHIDVNHDIFAMNLRTTAKESEIAVDVSKIAPSPLKQLI